LIWNTLFRKTTVIIILLSFFGTNVINSVGDQGSEEPNESPEVLMINETAIKLTIPLKTFQIGKVLTKEGMFATVELPGEGFSTTVGTAKLPLLKYMLEIPHSAHPETTIISLSWHSTSLQKLGLPDKIIPVQPSAPKIPKATKEFTLDTTYYATNEFIPQSIVTIADTGMIRERRFMLVEVSPLQYNPSTGEIKTMIAGEIIIHLPGSDLEKTYENIKRYTSPSFKQLFEELFVNYGFYEQNLSFRNEEGYLIIVHDDFIDEIQPFADLKENKGFTTVVKKTSKIPGGPTKENIQEYIEEAYYEWATPPTYVLLVGDTPQIPTFIGTTGPSAVDLYYVTINPEDYFPDIFIGRFPASTKYNVTAMVNKTMYYEQGKFNSTEWIKKAAFMAGTDNYTTSEGTHNYVIETYLEPQNYTYDKLYVVTNGATTYDVIDALNNGRSLAVFSGHGNPSGWGDGPPFYQSDVRVLTNKDAYPFVCSHACLTNTFDEPECFGETWLREENKAGLAFWGASGSTSWDEDDILEKGMFKAWWDDGLEWIGGMTDRGLYYLYENYSGGGETKYYFEAYNIMGDPSVHIWSEDPNPPPEKPEKPQGPDVGVINKAITFSSVTTDPDEEQIYYKFNWGDNTSSDWIGPYDSGDHGEASHVWTDSGEYKIKVRAKDEHDVESVWSDPLLITIVHGPYLDIGLITGGLFRINVEIKNIGSTNTTNVTWNISVEGGTLFLGRKTHGTIPSIQPDTKTKIQSDVLVGFGTIQVTVTVEIPEEMNARTQSGKILLFLIHINPGG